MTSSPATAPAEAGRSAAPDPLPDPLDRVAGLAARSPYSQYVVYERAGVWTYAGGVHCGVALDNDRTVITLPDGSRRERRHPDGGPAELDAALAALPLTRWQAFGWVGFEFSAGVRTTMAPGTRLARLLVPRVQANVSAAGIEVTGVDAQEVERVRAALLATAPPSDATTADIATNITVDAQGYRDRVRTALAEIAAGRYEKVILSRRIPLPGPVDFPATYRRGRRANTPARSFLLDVDGLQAAGFSPELVLTLDAHGMVSTNPLAGTRAFGRGTEIDLAARGELVTDAKEVYEHAISVRSALEEIRTVTRPGTAGVSDFMGVSERGSVQHLASTVRGQLAAGHTGWDALDTLFPAVTASGIPKAGAVDAIRRLDEPRGLYSGAVVSVSSTGELDAALVLRAVYQEQGGAWLRAGAGIVRGSVPDREFEETCEKLGSVLPHVVAADAAR